MNNLEKIVSAALEQFRRIDDAAALEQAKAHFLGKTGALTDLLKGLGKLPAEERREAGSRINAAKDKLEAALTERREASSITAAEFLHHFAGSTPWAHLDIAGTADNGHLPYLDRGGTGFGVRLLVEVARSLAQNP